MGNLIALLSDFGDRDGFVGIMKGVIMSINPDAHIIDLAHGIPAGDIAAAAFVLERSFKYFPKDTIHVVVVDPGVGSTRRSLILNTSDYYFIGPDNGVFNRIPAIENCVQITNMDLCLPVSNTFHGRDVFAPVAAHISKGVPLDAFGPPVRDFFRQPPAVPEKGMAGIRGEIIYIDRFGNLVSNISESYLRDCTIKDSIIKGYAISGLCHAYAERKKGEFLNIIGSHGNIEVACNQGSAAAEMEVTAGESLYIRFE